ncbi:hypothetical protein Tco_0535770 [Tanacetum coccineum]
MKGQEIAQPEISGRVRVQPLSIDFEYSATYRANFDSRETAPGAQGDSSDYVKRNLKPDTEVPEHYFKFIAYNEVESMADANGAPLTYYVGCIHQISDPITDTKSRVTRGIIDIQNLEVAIYTFLSQRENGLNSRHTTAYYVWEKRTR